jgi:hypothetical protein
LESLVRWLLSVAWILPTFIQLHKK